MRQQISNESVASASMNTPTLPDGLVLFVKRDCPTCVLVEPIMQQLAASQPLTIYTQDDPTFPAGLQPLDDTELERSYRHNIETVPTLIRVVAGRETARLVGWQKTQWQAFSGIANLGEGLPDYRPGCGSRSVEPGIAERLAVRFGGEALRSRRIELAELEDEMEAGYARGWSDGLPVVPPTVDRVLRMLQGTPRDAQEIVGLIPPNQAPCTVEKVAINAVLAGCLPEYLPVVLAAVEAALVDAFCMHGVLATTWFSGPVVIVNGPIARRIGMNSGVNALGQGNRANATIGRALQLIIRNVGGGKPGGIDRSTLGNPGKYTFCFAEREEDSPWESLAVEHGFAPGTSTVTLFAGDGVQPIYEQHSRTPASLARSFAACLRAVAHPKLAQGADAILVVCPEHGDVFRQAGWSKQRLRDELEALLLLPGEQIMRGASGIEQGTPVQSPEERIAKFRPGGLHIVHAGGSAGRFSAIISGWVSSGEIGSSAVTVGIRE
jgi:hypothetical protein